MAIIAALFAQPSGGFSAEEGWQCFAAMALAGVVGVLAFWLHLHYDSKKK
jgi:uncharacterized membrane protein YgaE (UPF0421/DUF939 family)